MSQVLAYDSLSEALAASAALGGSGGPARAWNSGEASEASEPCTVSSGFWLWGWVQGVGGFSRVGYVQGVVG